MQDYFFWNSWPRPYRSLAFAGLAFVILSLTAWGYYAFRGVDNVLHWDVLSELGEHPVTLDRFQAGGSSFSIEGQAYTLTEQFVASPMATANPVSDWLCLLLFLAGAALTLAAVSALPRLWYFGAMTAFIVLLSTLQVDTVAGRADRTITIVLVTVFTALSFYFHAFRPATGLWARVAVFTGVIALSVGALLLTGKGSVDGWLAYGYPAGMAVFTLFSFWISFEIMIGIVWLATNQSGRNGLVPFAALTVFYLTNLLFTQLHNSKLLDWNLLYISPFVFLIASVLLGFRGMKQREEQEAAPWPFAPQGFVLYAGLTTISFAMLARLCASANDPAIEALEDMVSYTHLIGGVLFFFYVFFNFGTMMWHGRPVHRILFKPPHFGRFHIRGLSAVALILFLYNSGFFPFYQAVAGYFNGLGDVATEKKDYRIAETFYNQGVAFEFQNHKSNYGLASLAWVQGDFASAARFFRQALAKQPSAYAYAGLTRSLMNEDLAFDAFFAAQEGRRSFPESGELTNNLAYLHAKAGGADSARYYYHKAVELCREKGVPEANLIALDVRTGKTPEATTSDYLAVRVNRQAIDLLQGKKEGKQPDIPTDSAMTLLQFADLSNAVLLGLHQEKPVFTDAAWRKLQERNEAYFDDLQYLQALSDYYKGDKLAGLDVLSARTLGDTSARGDRWRRPLAAFLNRESAAEMDPAPLRDWKGDGSELLLRQPLNLKVLERYTAEANRRKEPQKGYNALFNALKYRTDSPGILSAYILQSLETGLTAYADEKMQRLKEVDPAAYERFLPVYQQKRALIEKRREDFQ